MATAIEDNTYWLNSIEEDDGIKHKYFLENKPSELKEKYVDWLHNGEHKEIIRITPIANRDKCRIKVTYKEIR